MNIGFDQPLYLLPFDHRESFETRLFGWEGTLTAEQTAQVAAAKLVIYDGLQAAVAAGAPKEHACILVDEQFGAAILKDAAGKGYMTACPTEKSGQPEFEFEYGDDFARHIELIKPTFSKVLVRYNPEGDATLNRRQAERLKRLSDYLHGAGERGTGVVSSPSHPAATPSTNETIPVPFSRPLFMFELLVAAEPVELIQLHGDQQAYDHDLRPKLMVQAIHELQDFGIEPDVWKVEGMDRREDCVNFVAAARRGGRSKVGCIILGRGENDQKVHQWLATAASVPGFTGFAVGRTTFWQPLVDLLAKRIAREAAVQEIARRYREWVDIFSKGAAGGTG